MKVLCLALAVSSVQALKLLKTAPELNDKTSEQLLETRLLEGETAEQLSEDLMQGRKLFEMSGDRGCNYKGQWLYFRGDSALRQIVGEMIVSIGVQMTEYQLKFFFRQKCDRPAHSPDYKAFMDEHKGYGKGPCYVNEKKCDWKFNGTRLTYDWGHFVYEDREQYLFNKTAMLTDTQHDFKDGLPDKLILGMSVHACGHTNPNVGSAGADKNQAEEDKYISEISKLHTAIRSMYDKPIIYIEAAGVSTQPRRTEYMRCITRMNTELARVAKDDAKTVIIPRQAIEEAWVKANSKDQEVHKQKACVKQVYNKTCAAVEQ